MNLKKYFGFACFFLGILVIHVKPQLSTTGYVYDPISGNDEENNLSSERFIAYHDCWELGECGYVAKRRSDRKYVKLKIGATLNETNYSIIWKKRVEDINECASNPCQNNGSCVDKLNGYKCNCIPGYEGTSCETKGIACASNPCQNSGNCSNDINGYQCNCTFGFTGANCETDIDECASNPCQNSGNCTDGINGYKCNCTSGVTGANCETDMINECASNPCENGATCSDLPRKYKCICIPGYNGTNCGNKMYSCTDLYQNGARKNQIYYIFISTSKFKVYCDFESEANSTWTLIVSFALKNKGHFNSQLGTSAPVNGDNPNWDSYRIGSTRMDSVRTKTNLWRATCGFEKYGVDYRDYIRGKRGELDIMLFSGAGACRTVEFINIRGISGSKITVPFWQGAGQPIRTKSWEKKCNFNGTMGAVTSEDNFGYYNVINPAFRCTENQNGTTQLWFGDYV